MIYQICYTLLKKQIYAFSSEKLEVGDKIVVEIDNEKFSATIRQECTDHSIPSTVLGTNFILRKMSEIDEFHCELQTRRCLSYISKANQIARKYDSSCRIIACEPLFDIERMIFYFKVFEKIVNLRQVIKEVRELVQVQVDFRQVEGRDVAKILPVFGNCGAQTCCTRFLQTTPIISNENGNSVWKKPAKSLGMCGRIKCCTVFEHPCEKENCQCTKKQLQ